MPSSTTNNDTAGHRTQTSTFNWDDNNVTYKDPKQEAMDVEVPKEAGWKRIGSEHCKSTVKRGKTNGKVELNTRGGDPISGRADESLRQSCFGLRVWLQDRH
eukprot:15350063-Ditylum_brightwellii.AAC.1